MRSDDETVTIIPKCYVGEDCAQVRLYFVDNITLINIDFKNEKILCHYDFSSDTQNINKYLSDERRTQFPYHNIPIYKKLNGYKDDTQYYVNQLLEFNKHYILVSPDSIEDIYLVRDDKEAMVLSRSITIPSKIDKKLLKKQELFNKYKNRVLMAIDADGHHFDFEQDHHSLYKAWGGLLVITDTRENINHPDKENIKFVIIDVSSWKDEYWIKEYTIPFNHYTLEELKFMSQKIEMVEEPKISLRDNPSIKREEIRKAKRLARKLNKAR